MKPADLKPGYRIPAPEFGGLAVISVPRVDRSDEWPELNRVYVDVEVLGRGRWDCDNLPAATGAEAFTFLKLDPPRYRLTYLPDTEVEVEIGS